MQSKAVSYETSADPDMSPNGLASASESGPFDYFASCPEENYSIASKSPEKLTAFEIIALFILIVPQIMMGGNLSDQFLSVLDDFLTHLRTYSSIANMPTYYFQNYWIAFPKDYDRNSLFSNLIEPAIDKMSLALATENSSQQYKDQVKTILSDLLLIYTEVSGVSSFQDSAPAKARWGFKASMKSLRSLVSKKKPTGSISHVDEVGKSPSIPDVRLKSSHALEQELRHIPEGQSELHKTLRANENDSDGQTSAISHVRPKSSCVLGELRNGLDQALTSDNVGSQIGSEASKSGAHNDTAGPEVSIEGTNSAPLAQSTLDQVTCGDADSESTVSVGCDYTDGFGGFSRGERDATSGGTFGEWIESIGCDYIGDFGGFGGGERGATCGGALGEWIESGAFSDTAGPEISSEGERDTSSEERCLNQVVSQDGGEPSEPDTRNVTPGSEVLRVGTSSASSAQPTLDQVTCGSADSESRESGACNDTAGSENSSGGKRGASSEERCLNQALSQNGSKPNEPDPRNVTPGSEVLRVGTSSASPAQPALNQVVSSGENESQESGPHDSMADSAIREAELLTLGQVAPSDVGRSQGRRTSEGIVGNPQSGRSDNDPSTDLDVAISTGGPPLGVTSGVVRFVSQGYHDCLSEVLGNPSFWVSSVVPICWTAKTFVNMATSATAVMVCSTVLQAFCESWPYIAAWILYIVYTSRSTRMVPDTSSDTNTRSSRKGAMIAKVAYGVAVITVITVFDTRLRSRGNTRIELPMGVKVARLDASSRPSIPANDQLFAALPALARNISQDISTLCQWIKSFGGPTPVSVPTPVAWYDSTALIDRCNDILSFVTEYLSIGGAMPVSAPTPVVWYSSTALIERYNDIAPFITVCLPLLHGVVQLL